MTVPTHREHGGQDTHGASSDDRGHPRLQELQAMVRDGRIDTLIVATGLILMALIARALDGRKPSPPSGRRALEPATSVQ